MVSGCAGRNCDCRGVIWRLQPQWQVDNDIPQNRGPDSFQLSLQTGRAMGRREVAGEWRALLLWTRFELYDLCLQQPADHTVATEGRWGDQGQGGYSEYGFARRYGDRATLHAGCGEQCH